MRLASATDRAETVKDIRLTVSGLPEEGGTLEVTTSNKTVRLGGYCPGTGGALACSIGPGTDSIHFTINSQDVVAMTTVNFTVTPTGATEIDPDDNVVSVTLQPAE